MIPGAPRQMGDTKTDEVAVVVVGDARQRALDAFMGCLDGGDGPACYSYATLVEYLARACPAPGLSEVDDALACVADRLVAVGCEAPAGDAPPIYLADGGAYTAAGLAAEFPELRLFALPLAEAFVESVVAPGIHLETQRFADLRAFSRLRRELRRTGLAPGLAPGLEPGGASAAGTVAALLSALLGIEL